MRTSITIGLEEYVIEFDYKITSHGCPEQGPTYACGGQPAEPMEWEVDGPVTLIFEAQGKDDVILEVPKWLDEVLSAYIQEDTRGTIGPEIEEEAANDYDD